MEAPTAPTISLPSVDQYGNGSADPDTTVPADIAGPMEVSVEKRYSNSYESVMSSLIASDMACKSNASSEERTSYYNSKFVWIKKT